MRDFSRFGIAMLNDGLVDGKRVIPRAWIDDVRGGQHGHFSDAGRARFANGHYRNQFWIEDKDKPAHLCLGIFGQMIYVSPETGLVAVKLSTWPTFLDEGILAETMAGFHAIIRAFSPA